MFHRSQVEQNAEEVQQYMYNEFDYILYFENPAVFSLNTVHAFFNIIHAVKSVSCLMDVKSNKMQYSYKNIPCFGLHN